VPPLSLDTQELEIIRTASTPLYAKMRTRFLRDVIHELERHETIGPGLVARVATEVQRRYMNGDADGKREQAERRFKRRAD
jgi:hypothetical protein